MVSKAQLFKKESLDDDKSQLAAREIREVEQVGVAILTVKTVDLIWCLNRSLYCQARTKLWLLSGCTNKRIRNAQCVNATPTKAYTSSVPGKHLGGNTPLHS